jgi:nicotinamidase-related amidase
MNQERIHLVIIDPQNDFCDLPAARRPPGAAPALPVTGADADMLRLASFIDAACDLLTDISVTLDSHQHLDIAHPTFWRTRDGKPIGAFTQITAADVRTGRYLPRMGDALPRVIDYLDQLEASGRYTHMVWPVHCEIGTWGHNVHAAVLAAYNRWETATLRSVEKIVKGMNPWTEHFSAIRAEVPDPADAGTEDNAAFIARLHEADRILVAGEAGSHCVKATVEHVVEHLGAARLTLLVDCMSPVIGFEANYEAFIAAMRAAGATISTSTAVLPSLQRASAPVE